MDRGWTGVMIFERALVAFLALVALLTVFASEISSGDPVFTLLDRSGGAEYPPKVPVGPALQELGLILAGNGIASNSTALLPITLMVERTRVIRPSHAKKLFDCLDEIDAPRTGRESIDTASDYRGHMLLFERPYLLGDIEITGGDNVSDLEAKVLKTTARGGEEVVGHLMIKTEMGDRAWDGEGILSMEDGVIQGDYDVVLEMSPQAEKRSEEPKITTGLPPYISRIVSAGTAP